MIENGDINIKEDRKVKDITFNVSANDCGYDNVFYGYNTAKERNLVFSSSNIKSDSIPQIPISETLLGDNTPERSILTNTERQLGTKELYLQRIGELSNRTHFISGKGTFLNSYNYKSFLIDESLLDFYKLFPNNKNLLDWYKDEYGNQTEPLTKISEELHQYFVGWGVWHSHSFENKIDKMLVYDEEGLLYEEYFEGTLNKIKIM